MEVRGFFVVTEGTTTEGVTTEGVTTEGVTTEGAGLSVVVFRVKKGERLGEGRKGPPLFCFSLTL